VAASDTRSRKSTRRATGNGTVDEATVRQLLAALRAASAGDFDLRLAEGQGGLAGQLAKAYNDLADRRSGFADELQRVSRVVNREGRLTERVSRSGHRGAWRETVAAVNSMIDDLVRPTTEIARVIDAVADGDLSQKMELKIDGRALRGEFRRIGTTVNAMVDQLSALADEVTRVAREVGTEGKLGGQAKVKGASGVWKDLTDNVNLMASNLTAQVRDIAEVTTAVATGDLSKKISVDVKGEILELKDTINTMVDQLSSFADEVTRVAREVGTEGKLGGQARVKGVSGTWKDLTDNVNFMASNLTTQVRGIARVVTAVANGDLDRKFTIEAQGEVAELADTINSMIDTLRAFAGEVTRVAREVGTRGILGGQADVKGVSGVWKDLTDNVNTLANNLTAQVRNIAEVTTAVATGDLSKKITVDVKGEILELKNTINTMVDQLRSFADEVTRVAKEVGTEGKLGGQAKVEGVSGTWKDLTDNVNTLADNLTFQVRNIADVTTAVAQGDLSKKITVAARGEILELKETINTMVDQLRSFAAEVTRVAREVGTEGILGGQARVEGVSGVWKDLTDNVNFMASNLTGQVSNIAEEKTAVAEGDLGRKITVDVKGEILQLKNTINTMVDQLSSFADEVTRVAREVGTEGKLGGQARVKGISGTWKDLTDSVNTLADNLTSQVRNIAEVTTAVAQGDLSQKITVDARGEVQKLKSTINTMVDQLSSFAAEVTRVAKEVGTEGRLGGQAEVKGVSGVWKDLTDNVNSMAASLTTQVRAIADVSTAVTQGDLTRSISVDAKGEVAELKDNINEMIRNLAETTDRNAAQDWLNSNLARFTGMMQGQRNLETVSRMIMSELTPLVGAHHGAFFIAVGENEDVELKLISSYAYKQRRSVANRFRIGEGIVGQAALEKTAILLTEAPEDYIRIASGLGEASPHNILVLPALFEGKTMAVIELASFQPFSETHQAFLEQLMESLGIVINVIEQNMRTEQLLEQSQQLTEELQERSEELQSQQEELKRSNVELEMQAASLKTSEELLQQQQEELQQTNEELEEKAMLLEEQNSRIEIKNREIEDARASLEEKAELLALSSKYKSEFLANMSHELRTPLNSMLILARLFVENPENNLSQKQIEFATTIYTAGSDLLNLINDILDLSKVEAGKMDVQISDVPLTDVRDYVDRTFRPVAEQKALQFAIEIDEATVPPAIGTDEQRLQQVLKNLLSNACKFTDSGSVSLRVSLAAEGTRFQERTLRDEKTVVAFAVSDSGVGIAEDKVRLIFEAFQQADGTTSRRYGGTGLGLSISREIARLLGGEIHVESRLGEGSTFTLYLPASYNPSQVQPSDEPLTRERVAALDPAAAPDVSLNPALLTSQSAVADDRGTIDVDDRFVLIVEDDETFAKTVLEVARERGFKGIVALRGDVGLALAHEYKPDAIVLDMQLPGMDGWAVLDHLKRHPDTRHIPVHVVTGAQNGRQHALRAGAVAFLEKPVDKSRLDEAFSQIASFLERGVRNLLVVDDEQTQRQSIIDLLGDGEDVQVTAVESSEEALAELEQRPFDCMVLDLKLPNMQGFQLLERVKTDERFTTLPVIIYTSKQLTRKEETSLRRYAETIIVKDVRSPERLLDETSLFLHRVESRLPVEKRKLLQQLHSADAVLEGRKVLVVDDDVRNVFALTSVLEARRMDVRYAENGVDAIRILEEDPNIAVVLMDIMMPELDGYETIRHIRSMPQFESLPIISLTAKAMKGDREKSIAAGASDYIAKPVDTDKLVSLLRVWLYDSSTVTA
jgi:HAMP domain-containing protein/CheY-like chemotaxis protein/putative methionine-R-sulfoxide reductase with GAF domain